jgi:hypothetical protein
VIKQRKNREKQEPTNVKREERKAPSRKVYSPPLKRHLLVPTIVSD